MNPSAVALSVGRWTATLTVMDSDGKTEQIVFSADAAHTQRDGLFVGTYQEMREMEW